MGKGIFFGAVCGLLCGLFVMAVLSLYEPLPGEVRGDEAASSAVAPTPEPTTEPTVVAPSDSAVTPQASPQASPETDTAQAPAVVEDVPAAVPAAVAEIEEPPVVTAPSADAADAKPVEAAEPAVEETEIAAPSTPEQLAPEPNAPQVLDAAPQVAGATGDQSEPELPALLRPQSASPQPAEALTVLPASDAPVADVEVPARSNVSVADSAEPLDTPAQAEGSLVLTARLPEQTQTAPTQPETLALPETDAAPVSDLAPATPIELVLEPDAPAAPTQSAAATTPSVVEDLIPATADQFTSLSADTPITLPVPVADTPTTGVVVNRLPRIGEDAPEAPAEEDSTAEEAEVVEAAPEQSGPEQSGPALVAFAADVEVAEGTSGLIGLILIDEGRDAPLGELAVPFTIALAPSTAGAKERSAFYRGDGVEILAMLDDLPETAAPGDVAVAMDGYFAVLDQAIGVLDPLDARIQSNRSLAGPVVDAISESGHALVTYDRGLNSAQQSARRAGVPSATVFRVLDAENEGAPKIKRYLKRAAFNAARDGSVLVLAHNRPGTIAAILEWALEEKAADLAIVPASQLMLSDLPG